MKALKKFWKKMSQRMSPHHVKLAGAAVVASIAVVALVLVAHQATPAASVAPVPKQAAAPAPEPEPKETFVKAKTANAKTGAQASEIVTITGCLEEKNDSFRLKETSGADAPKSRSWKTLGLTKHASTVTVVDSTRRMKLDRMVGERVSVTGTIVDKEMQLKSVKALSPSCD